MNLRELLRSTLPDTCLITILYVYEAWIVYVIRTHHEKDLVEQSVLSCAACQQNLSEH